MSKSPPKQDNDSSTNFLNNVYKKLSQDPDQSKLNRLMSNVSTHAIAEQFPGFQQHFLLSQDHTGQPQFLRIDNNPSNPSLTVSPGRGDSIRSKLKGHYPRPNTSPPKLIENNKDTQAESGQDDKRIMDIDELAAYITQADDKKKKKNKNKSKKKKSKKSISPSITEEGDEDEAKLEILEGDQSAEDVEIILGSSRGDSTAEEDDIQDVSTIISPSEDTQPILVDTINTISSAEKSEKAILSLEDQTPQEEIPLEEVHTDTHPHHRADDIITSSIPQSPIKVKLPPNNHIIPLPSRSPSPYPPQFENNIIYFGDIPVPFFRSDIIDDQQPSLDETVSHTRNSSTADEEIITPTLKTTVDLSHTAIPFIPQRNQPKSQSSSPSSTTMPNHTPPQSPPMGQDPVNSSAFAPSSIVKHNEPISIQIERPLTPPPDIDDEEEDGTLVFPTEPPKVSLSATKTIDIQPIPSITLNTPTSPSFLLPQKPFYPLTHSWKLYYSNTSHQRKTSLPSSPLNPNPLGSHPNAADYSSHLFTLFEANNLEDLFGSWKALRRKISIAKKRPIEPIGDNLLKGGPGLGTQFFPDETNFHFFKNDIQPMWEDKMCQKGGKIMIAGEALAMDNLFFDAILLLISGELDAEIPPPMGSASTICGVVLSRRKLTRIEIWLGGEEPPAKQWVHDITRFLEDRFRNWRVYGYKAFGKNG